jgi:hypothetical protein
MSLLTWSLCFRAGEAAACGPGDGYPFQTLLEAEAGWNQLLQGAITLVCDGLGVEPDADTEEDAPGNSFARRMVALGCLVRDKIREGCIMV